MGRRRNLKLFGTEVNCLSCCRFVLGYTRRVPWEIFFRCFFFQKGAALETEKHRRGPFSFSDMECRIVEYTFVTHMSLQMGIYRGCTRRDSQWVYPPFSLHILSGYSPIFCKNCREKDAVSFPLHH